MAELPGVSVVIPTYNRANILGEALDSAFNQDHPNLEIVVVDDGSTDRTAELVEEYRDRYGPRLRMVSQANAGESAARNAGIHAAQHEFIALLDSDNRWLSSKLTRQLELHAQDPSLGFSFTGYTTFGGASSDRVVLNAWDPEPVEAIEQLLVGCCINTSTVLATKRSIIDAGMFDTSLRCAEDHDLWLRIAANGCRIGYLPEALTEYRLHSDALSSDPALVADSTERVMARLFAEGIFPDSIQAKERSVLARWYLNSACRYIEARDGQAAINALASAARKRPASIRPGWVRLFAEAVALLRDREVKGV
jgi:glycosyltransferase involved in cell wall biosynthesis